MQELLKTTFEQAIELAHTLSNKNLLDLVPNFEENFNKTLMLASLGHTKRKDMPVINSKDINNFKTELSDNNIKHKNISIKVKDIKPTQEQIYIEKALKPLMSYGVKKSIDFIKSKTSIISKDGYLIDGHHRFLTGMLINPDIKIKAIQVDLNKQELLDFSLSFSDNHNIRNESHSFKSFLKQLK